jgi:hypothetical protein
MMSHCNQLVGESYGDEGQKTGGGVEESWRYKKSC